MNMLMVIDPEKKNMENYLHYGHEITITELGM